MGTPATECWRRSASSPRTNSPPRPRSIEVSGSSCRYFADSAVAHWEIWDGPRQRDRSTGSTPSSPTCAPGFAGRPTIGDLTLAAAIAAHTAIMSWPLQRFEPVGWAEEILEAATAADLPQLPRLYMAASLCLYRASRRRRRLRRGRCNGWRPIPATTRSSTAGAASPGARPPLRWTDRSPGGDLRRAGHSAGVRSGDRPLRADLGAAGGRSRRGGHGDRRRNGRCRS